MGGGTSKSTGQAGEENQHLSGAAAAHVVTFPLAESTLPLAPDGQRVYHLSVGPAELSRNILIVGDPDRVPVLAKEFLVDTEIDVSHRGLRTITGHVASGMRLSIVTSGMGQPSMEIVMNELAALHELDVASRSLPKDRPEGHKVPPLHVIRLGTCGALHEDIPLGTAVITAYSLGLDNTGVFYDTPAADEASEKLEKMAAHLLTKSSRPGARFASRMQPYCARAHPDALKAIKKAAKEIELNSVVGVTASASGFFANQGRVLLPSLAPTVPEVDHVISQLSIEVPQSLTDDGCAADAKQTLRVENMEMETSSLLHLCGALQYRAAAICLTVAHRRKSTFLTSGYQELVMRLAQVAIRALETLDKEPEASPAAAAPAAASSSAAAAPEAAPAAAEPVVAQDIVVADESS